MRLHTYVCVYIYLYMYTQNYWKCGYFTIIDQAVWGGGNTSVERFRTSFSFSFKDCSYGGIHDFWANLTVWVMYQRFDPIPVVNDLEISCIWGPGSWCSRWKTGAWDPMLILLGSFCPNLAISHSQFKALHLSGPIFQGVRVALYQVADPFWLVHSQYGFLWSGCVSTNQTSFTHLFFRTLGCPIFKRTQTSYCWIYIFIQVYNMNLSISHRIRFNIPIRIATPQEVSEDDDLEDSLAAAWRDVFWNSQLETTRRYWVMLVGYGWLIAPMNTTDMIYLWYIYDKPYLLEL